MTVRELIEALSKQPPDAEVCIEGYDLIEPPVGVHLLTQADLDNNYKGSHAAVAEGWVMVTTDYEADHSEEDEEA